MASFTKKKKKPTPKLAPAKVRKTRLHMGTCIRLAENVLTEARCINDYMALPTLSTRRRAKMGKGLRRQIATAITYLSTALRDSDD